MLPILLHPVGNAHRYVIRPKWLLCLLVLSLTMHVACARRITQTADIETVEQGAPTKFVFSPGDIVEVMVWKNQDLSREVTVRSDGKISLPLVGDIHAAGFTTDELSDAITQKLLTYYKDKPTVSIIVKQSADALIFVLGEVENQGKFSVSNGTTLLQAIALAGGFSEFASRNKIIMRRKDHEGKEIIFNFRYKDVLAGREQNIVIQHGDTIIVQ